MAPGCSNNRKNNTRVHYHRLPLSKPSLTQVWLAKMKLAKPPKLEFARVCSVHFMADDYETTGTFDDSGRFVYQQTKNLKPAAVPTLFDFSSYSKGGTDAPSSSTSCLSARTQRMQKRKQQQEQQHVKHLCQVIKQVYEQTHDIISFDWIITLDCIQDNWTLTIYPLLCRLPSQLISLLPTVIKNKALMSVPQLMIVRWYVVIHVFTIIVSLKVNN